MSRHNSGIEERLLPGTQADPDATVNFHRNEEGNENATAVTIPVDAQPTVSSESTLKKFNDNFLIPLMLMARAGGAPWMVYANDVTQGIPSIYGPSLMTLANLHNAAFSALAHYGVVKKETAQAIQMRNLPVLFTMVCAFMMAEQVDQLEGNLSEAQRNNTRMIMGAIGSFVMPIALYVLGIEGLLKKLSNMTNDDYVLMTKAFVLPALAMFYYVTGLKGVLVLAADELHQTATHAAPRVQQLGSAVVNGITTFRKKDSDTTKNPGVAPINATESETASVTPFPRAASASSLSA